jgi:hypothetical protein
MPALCVGDLWDRALSDAAQNDGSGVQWLASSQPSPGQDTSGARCGCPDLAVVPRVGVQTYLSCGLNRDDLAAMGWL